MKTIDQVRIFHATFGHPTADAPTRQSDDPTLQELRINLLAEEVQELKDALVAGDLLEVLDALTDIQYVLDGAYLVFGMAHIKEEAFMEVHRSNMSKLGADGLPVRRDDGKILKGPDYFRPDLAQFLKCDYCGEIGSHDLDCPLKCDYCGEIGSHDLDCPVRKEETRSGQS